MRALEAAPRDARAERRAGAGQHPGRDQVVRQRTRSRSSQTFLRLTEQAAASRPDARRSGPRPRPAATCARQLEQALERARLRARAPGAGLQRLRRLRLRNRWHDRAISTPPVCSRPMARLGDRYAKRHLVPFGERMPFERLFPALGRLDLGPGRVDGRASVRCCFRAPPDRSRASICFESIFPGPGARGDVRGGARWLVNVTNDEWFGNSAALDQHAAMAVFRAVENHVPLARCANTGLTMLIDANGRVTAAPSGFKSAVLVGDAGRARASKRRSPGSATGPVCCSRVDAGGDGGPRFDSARAAPLNMAVLPSRACFGLLRRIGARDTNPGDSMSRASGDLWSDRPRRPDHARLARGAGFSARPPPTDRKRPRRRSSLRFRGADIAGRTGFRPKRSRASISRCSRSPNALSEQWAEPARAERARRDRQQQRVPLPRRRSAGGARDQRRAARVASDAGRESELLDHRRS